MQLKEIKLGSLRVYTDKKVFDVVFRREVVGKLTFIQGVLPDGGRRARALCGIAEYGNQELTLPLYRHVAPIRSISEAKKEAKVWFKEQLEKNERVYGNK